VSPEHQEDPEKSAGWSIFAVAASGVPILPPSIVRRAAWKLEPSTVSGATASMRLLRVPGVCEVSGIPKVGRQRLFRIVVLPGFERRLLHAVA
jgi:hypothetical protein